MERTIGWFINYFVSKKFLDIFLCSHLHLSFNDFGYWKACALSTVIYSEKIIFQSSTQLKKKKKPNLCWHLCPIEETITSFFLLRNSMLPFAPGSLTSTDFFSPGRWGEGVTHSIVFLAWSCFCRSSSASFTSLGVQKQLSAVVDSDLPPESYGIGLCSLCRSLLLKAAY